jgi:hypothetical protein
MLLSFSLDVDIKDIMSEINSINIIRDIIKNVIDGCKNIYKYEIKYDDIYVLQSNIYNEESKKSYHIIFKGLVFKNYTYCRDFYNYLDIFRLWFKNLQNRGLCLFISRRARATSSRPSC